MDTLEEIQAKTDVINKVLESAKLPYRFKAQLINNDFDTGYELMDSYWTIVLDEGFSDKSRASDSKEDALK